MTQKGKIVYVQNEDANLALVRQQTDIIFIRKILIIVIIYILFRFIDWNGTTTVWTPFTMQNTKNQECVDAKCV